MPENLELREQRATVEEQSGRGRNLERPEVPEPLPGPVVDSHCHLDVADGKSHLSPVDALAIAASVGVTRIAQVGCDVEGSRWAVAAAERFDSVIAAVAIHPNDAARMVTEGSGDGRAELDRALTEIESLAARDRVRAVGETGLDYFRTRDDLGQRVQKAAFAAQIGFAKKHVKALVIHDRDAHADILDVLDAEGVPERIIMHCFSGDADFARQCLDRGAFLSFAGTITFKNADPLREALKITPLDRILVETDAPYLTPVPYRGRPNASYLIPHTARVMAETREVDLGDFCQALNDNADVAFGGTWG